MPSRPTSAAVALLLGLAVVACPAAAQGPPAAPRPSKAPEENRDRGGGRTRPDRREPSVGQIALRERQRKCGVEWREMKAGGKVADGMKWP